MCIEYALQAAILKPEYNFSMFCLLLSCKESYETLKLIDIYTKHGRKYILEYDPLSIITLHASNGSV